MVCSSCGYDNPREHRYCGMCGTPFPHRPLTVPDAQSTLSFSSAPLEVLPAPLSVRLVESSPTEPLSSIEPAAEHAVHDWEESTEVAQAAAPAIEVVPLAPQVELRVSEPAPALEAAAPAPAPPEPSVEAAEPTPFLPDEEPAPIAGESVPEVAHAAGAAIVVEPAAAVEAATPAPAPPEPSVEAAEPTPWLRHEEPAPIAVEPALEVAHAAEAAPVAEPPPLPVEEPAPPPILAEPAPPVPEMPRDQAPHPIPEVREPTPPARPVVATARPRIVPRPALPRREALPARTETLPHRPAVPRPSPDSIPLASPPASAGMPTFQSVAEAAGPPAIHPFEPPVEKHPDQDRELQEFVANFRYTPPDETVDELTMRSEAPVIDNEPPAEFHHASFDGDEPPPPEAGAHPTGKEYYPPAAGFADRSHFLEMSETRHPAPGPKTVDTAGTSFLGLDGSPPAAPPIAESSPPTSSRWLLWTSLLALLAIFGGLGFLEGRAQMTQAFRGPVEIVHEQYEKLRQRISGMRASAPAATPAPPAPQAENQTPPSSEPAPANQTSSAGNPQPDNSAQNASPAPPAAAPANSEVQPQQAPPATRQVAPATDNANSAAAPSNDVAKAELLKPIEAPTPQPSTKPQPGQQELAKALDASDSAAAAAWLWKATSRGNPEAPVRLADMYIKGKGVPHSCEQALVLLRSAATKQNAPARNRLAALYANGTCVPRDPVRAYQLMSSALEADPTSEWAEQNRKELWNRMTPGERAEAEKYR